MYEVSVKGNIFNIKRFAIHDGPGIRTTVFFKGCPLNCIWCHNPEGMGDCRDGDESEFKGVDEILDILEKDILFYDESQGGVTVSGGEPFEQPEFLIKLLKELKTKDIHTALDTTGFADESLFREVAEYVDLYLYDLKLMDEKLHMKFTGVPNPTILKNFDILKDMKKKVWVRFPMIPGINDHYSNINSIGEFIRGKDNVERLSVLPYHKLGSHKYNKFGLEWKMGDLKTPEENVVKKVCKRFEDYGLKVFKGG